MNAPIASNLATAIRFLGPVWAASSRSFCVGAGLSAGLAAVVAVGVALKWPGSVVVHPKAPNAPSHSTAAPRSVIALIVPPLARLPAPRRHPVDGRHVLLHLRVAGAPPPGPASEQLLAPGAGAHETVLATAVLVPAVPEAPRRRVRLAREPVGLVREALRALPARGLLGAMLAAQLDQVLDDPLAGVQGGVPRLHDAPPAGPRPLGPELLGHVLEDLEEADLDPEVLQGVARQLARRVLGDGLRRVRDLGERAAELVEEGRPAHDARPPAHLPLEGLHHQAHVVLELVRLVDRPHQPSQRRLRDALVAPEPLHLRLVRRRLGLLLAREARQRLARRATEPLLELPGGKGLDLDHRHVARERRLPRLARDPRLDTVGTDLVAERHAHPRGPLPGPLVAAGEPGVGTPGLGDDLPVDRDPRHRLAPRDPQPHLQIPR